jgi:hydroxymethylbilane synthase
MTPTKTGAHDGVLRLATRGSVLARRQTELVTEMLLGSWPQLRIEAVVMETRGDQSSEPLDRIGGQGIFVKEIQAAVLDGRADVAVHSAKDLPSQNPDELRLACVPHRADPRDALVGCRLDDLGPGATVATGSARRRSQLANLRPDLTFVELRGNMGTRVSKATDGSVAAVVVAVAAMARLGWMDQIAEILDPVVMLPQVGQGAIALECGNDNDLAKEILAAIDHAPSHRAVRAERGFLAAMGADCSVPVGAFASEATELKASEIELSGLMATGDGRVLLRTSRRGRDPDVLGHEVATLLLTEAGGAALEGFTS